MLQENKNLRQQTFSLQDVERLNPCNREALTEWLARYPNSEVAITPVIIRRAADARVLNPWWFTSLFLRHQALADWIGLRWTMNEADYRQRWFRLASDNMTPEVLEELRVLSGTKNMLQFGYAESRLRAELAVRALVEIVKEGEVVIVAESEVQDE